MAKDPVWDNRDFEPAALVLDRNKIRYRSLEWVQLYQNGYSTTNIAEEYQVGASTVRRHLKRYATLRDRISACVAASTKFLKTPFSGSLTEGAYTAGFVEPIWQELVNGIEMHVREYKKARLDYTKRHNGAHPNEKVITGGQ